MDRFCLETHTDIHVFMKISDSPCSDGKVQHYLGWPSKPYLSYIRYICLDILSARALVKFSSRTVVFKAPWTYKQ
jgi:hypothetical protein